MGTSDYQQRVTAGVATEEDILHDGEWIPRRVGAEVYGTVRTEMAKGRRQGPSIWLG